MSVTLGQRLKIRSMIYVAAEPVPYFWPMRSFIHHNPLHGLEHMPFNHAVEKGARLFHGRGFLPRSTYQRYLRQGKIDLERLEQEVLLFAVNRTDIASLNPEETLMTLLTKIDAPVMLPTTLTDDVEVQAVLQGGSFSGEAAISSDLIAHRLRDSLLGDRPVYEAVDTLYGTEIGASLDELVIKSCLDFFDEGQSVWRMPNRELGFFAAWRQVAMRNIRLFLRGMNISEILAVDDTPEGVIHYVMKTLDVPEQHWTGYFSRELARLHGWAGFIRWRANAKSYHWAQRYPGDLVDYMAVRLTLALALLGECGRQRLPDTGGDIRKLIESRTYEAYLRHEFYGGEILPEMAHRVERVLLRRSDRAITQVFGEYIGKKRLYEAQQQAARLRELMQQSGTGHAMDSLSVTEFSCLLAALRDFERQEGMFWLRAMESKAMTHLLDGISHGVAESRDKRPFAQALFCIDTRSERIRRHLEGIGDYQTYGIAGFFGVPVSFMELGKGSEAYLCPVLLTPKNLVLEMSMLEGQEEAALGSLEKVLHALKDSVLTPFVTVEAIGLLFGFDLAGKTIAPLTYNRWRHGLQPKRTVTRLLFDKLTREQADSIVRAVQRAVIVKAVGLELQLTTERLTDELIRDLRESAMGHDDSWRGHTETLGVSEGQLGKFVERLRNEYRINPAFVQMQMERLGRIGLLWKSRYISYGWLSNPLG